MRKAAGLCRTSSRRGSLAGAEGTSCILSTLHVYWLFNLLKAFLSY